MAKRTLPLVLFLAAFSLSAFADSTSQRGSSSNLAAGTLAFASSSQLSGLFGGGDGFPGWPPSHNPPPPPPDPGKPTKNVPEPASLLVFGTGLLLGVGVIRRKLGA